MTIVNGQVADADEVLAGYGNPLSQLAYEQVKSDSTNWTNTDYLGADIFTDSDGAKDTVDTGTTTALYNVTDDNYRLNITDEASGDSTSDPNSFTNPSNAFDDDDGTYSQKTTSGQAGGAYDYSLGKTFSSKTVTWAKIKATFSGTNMSPGNSKINLQTYNGSIWTTILTLVTGGESEISYDDIYFFNSEIQGIRIQYSYTVTPLNGSTDAKLYTLEYGNYDSSSTVETDSIIDEKIPDSIVVYGKTTIPTNTSITVDVSDDGGTTFGLTGKSLNTPIDTSTFSTGNLALKFNLATTDTSVSPKLYGYGVTLTDI